MLTNFFAKGDRKVEHLAAWLQRLGPSGFLVLALFIYGAVSTVHLVRFVLAR